MHHNIVRVAAAAAALAIGAADAAGAQSLRGSLASVDLMYASAQSHRLVFLQTPAEVYAAALSHALELVSATDDLQLGGVKYPFVLPNTRRFADSLAAAYHRGCGERLMMTSGARPTDEQPRNASPKSVHPTGMAIDFRKPRAPACLAWLRTNLLALENRHVIEATEEQHPAHFHVAVLNQAPERRITVAAAGIVVPTPARAATAARHRRLARRPRKALAQRSGGGR